MRALLIAATLISTSGCLDRNSYVATLNLNYAKTSLGFRNTGALSAGRLYLWDQNDNSLVIIASGIPLPELPPGTPGDREANDVNSFAIQTRAELTSQTSSDIAIEVRSELSFLSRNALIVENRFLESAISAVYTELKRTHEKNPDETPNPFVSWRVEDATGNPERFKYILLYNEVRASEEMLKFKDSVGDSVSFDIPTGDAGSISVSIAASTTQSCKETEIGERTVCYINAKAYRVFLKKNGNLDYSPISVSNLALASALRNLN